MNTGPRDFLWAGCLKHFHFPERRDAKSYIQNAQPYQHMSHQTASIVLKQTPPPKSGKHPTTKETQPKDDASRKFPAVSCPPGNKLIGNKISWFSIQEGKEQNILQENPTLLLLCCILNTMDCHFLSTVLALIVTPTTDVFLHEAFVNCPE